MRNLKLRLGVHWCFLSWNETILTLGGAQAVFWEGAQVPRCTPVAPGSVTFFRGTILAWRAQAVTCGPRPRNASRWRRAYFVKKHTFILQNIKIWQPVRIIERNNDKTLSRYPAVCACCVHVLREILITDMPSVLYAGRPLSWKVQAQIEKINCATLFRIGICKV